MKVVRCRDKAVVHPTCGGGQKQQRQHRHCNRPATEFLPKRPPFRDAIHNVYELKTQPKLVHYYHTAAGFPTKPTWIKAIRNKQFASWPGLTVDAVKRHYPDSEETPKGHGRETPSKLR
jgi:hypothetical protein